MTDMELDVFERAWNHYEEKHNKNRRGEYNQDRFREFWNYQDRFMEFWEDYFSGKPLYTTQEFRK